MMSITTNAIICKKIEWKESSFIYHAFSKKFGYLSFIAHGIKKSKNISKDSLQLFNEVELVLNKNNEADVYNMKSVDLIYTFPVSIDYKNYILINSVFEIIRQVLIDPNESEEIYLYLLKYIKYIDQIKSKHFLYYSRFIYQFFEKIHSHFFLLECDLCHKQIKESLMINNSNQYICKDCNNQVKEIFSDYIKKKCSTNIDYFDENLKLILFYNDAFWSHLDLLEENPAVINQFKIILKKQFSQHFKRNLTLVSLDYYKS